MANSLPPRSPYRGSQDDSILGEGKIKGKAKMGGAVGLCQLLSNWGIVAAKELAPIISGELMKKVR